MHLEFHQFDRRWEHLRVRHPPRERRLLASLAESGQETPTVVVAAEGQVDRYVVIDGYKRIAALERLGRDTVEAMAWPMSEAATVLLDRSLRLSEHETALEVGWLVQELEQRFGYSLDELARRFDRRVTWADFRAILSKRVVFGVDVIEREALQRGRRRFWFSPVRGSPATCNIGPANGWSPGQRPLVQGSTAIILAVYMLSPRCGVANIRILGSWRR
jgi:uncharacterized ParB-like nuclease family protein